MTSAQPACRCVICHDYGDRAAAGRSERWAVEQVRQHGWGVVMVPADEEGPGFAYTVGLWHTHRAPELAMFGLADVHAMHTVLNALGERAGAGGLVAGREQHGVLADRPVLLRTADLRWYRAFFGQAIGFHRRPPFPVLQVVWPDHRGRHPGDPAADPGCRDAQPQLWLRPAEHPRGVWTDLAEG
ncbi:DUF4262 domain-containing protein [Kitasatospora sp. NPDC088134]|uniref:DUF4262 domain-containing protein n=1 Tax=Kitasatospora sp. NPDC088134 TaxID=3364071 RepID=UPI003811BF16